MRVLLIGLLLVGCGDDSAVDDAGSDATSDATRDGARDAPSDSPDDSPDEGQPDAPVVDAPAVDAPPGSRGAVRFVENPPNASDYGLALETPPGFGDDEMTMELWIRLAPGPVGLTTDDTPGQRTNWAEEDVMPYDGGEWWFKGNFLLDGHNNRGGFNNGTFSLQLYGGGRLRWLFGDGAVGPSGGLWSAGAYPATTTNTLLDDEWHGVALVRRWVDADAAALEIWIDGSLVDSEPIDARIDMRRWWDDWDDFEELERGWFWGAEKQAAVDRLSQYEDYKGDLAEIRFWSRARTIDELGTEWNRPVTGDEPGLVGWIPFDEGSGDMACDVLDRSRCIQFFRTDDSIWVEGPPL